jgi:hypothetical protein
MEFTAALPQRYKPIGFLKNGENPEAVDMNGRFQMQGGKNWFLPKEMNANRFFWDSHWLLIWSNHFCPSMGSNGGSVATDSGLYCTCALLVTTCPLLVTGRGVVISAS